ncbi:hypothetical protein PLICRDRAFT_361512 [Plicaturopsis crispa FD-325 SS-3]|uniref:Secreted protein n=1 Tax=Plicaturopsis crispa FD-325 SS-3 TaxID=944288 RepID=A0A0C9SR46_PLICR|nr:hypothetical protein PLICRDRAFT_361512 [Plicaturopsis crispa FD-325 SS-3]
MFPLFITHTFVCSIASIQASSTHPYTLRHRLLRALPSHCVVLRSHVCFCFVASTRLEVNIARLAPSSRPAAMFHFLHMRPRWANVIVQL